MADFNLSGLRKLLPSRRPLPDHPMASLDEAKTLLWQMQGTDPRAAVADLTNWYRSFSIHDGFTPGRRARILLLIGEAIRPRWRLLAHDYLAPDDEPKEYRPGEQKLLLLMLAAREAETAAWTACFVEDAPPSRWLEENLALVLVRWTRALVLGATLSRMLQRPPGEGVWVKINYAFRRARLAKAEGRLVAAFGDETRRTSVRQEFIRGALIELASPDGLKARELELLFRIAGRFAATVQLTAAENPDAMYAVDPDTDTGPVSLLRVSERKPGLLYFDMSNCIAQMRPYYEAGRSEQATAPDARFGSVFTVREGSSMLKHALDRWGSHPPQRKANRLSMRGSAKVAHGLERAQSLCALYDQGGFSAGDGQDDSAGATAPADKGMRIAFDDKKVAEALTTAKVARESSAQMLDASTTGLGLLLAISEARWAKVGTLLCVHAEVSNDWVLGIIRRARPSGKGLTVGVEIVCHFPQVAWLRIASSERELVWQDAMSQERSFDTHFARAILLTEPPRELGAVGRMLLPPGRVRPGSGLEMPLAAGRIGLRVREVQNSQDDYARVTVEWVPLAARQDGSADEAPARKEGATPAREPEAVIVPDAAAASTADPSTAAEVAGTRATPPALPLDQWRLVDHDAQAAPPPVPRKDKGAP